MAERIEIDAQRTLSDHAEYAHLATGVARLREIAGPVAERLRGRTVWMVNSTAQGGGVAEMLPGMVSHLRELGIAAEWVVMNASDDRFFELTKRIHNMLHGSAGAELTAADRELYDATNLDNALVMARCVKPADIVVVHDPQPMAMAGMLAERVPITAVWRCHIGLDTQNDATRGAWSFLEPYAPAYAHAVFSAAEYVPPFLAGRSTIIYPAIDPLAAKNQPMHVQSVVEILERAGLVAQPTNGLLPPYVHQARRVHGDGSFGEPGAVDPIGLLRRPIITQVSRWDRLKGFLPLMRGFAQFKRNVRGRGEGGVDQRRLQLSRLVLAGPDPESIADDPEGRDVLAELIAEYVALPEELRMDIAILALPMADANENALIVNALQRVSTVVAQNSLREGFGLTITEAMWKAVPVLTNSTACGPRQQVRDGREGRMIADPEDTSGVAAAIESMLGDLERLDTWGRSAQRRVHEEFLIHSQIGRWLQLLSEVA